MNISKRLYTYPVLSEETTDYVGKEFGVTMKYEMSTVSDIEFDFEFELNSEYLQELIKNKEAEFMIHAECSSTAYRNAFRSPNKRICFEIPLQLVNGTIELVAFIVAKKNIKKYSSKEWCDDFDGLSFDLEKGSILAYRNLENIEVTKDYEDFTDSNSIVSIVKKFSDKPIPSDVNLESNRIKIGLYEKDYDEYSKKVKHNPETIPVLNTMIILPALVYAFDELKYEENIEKYSGRNWFISLEKAFEKRGKKFKEELLDEDKTGYSLAQEVMELPLGKSLSQLKILLDGEEDQEDDE